ncbi:LOW QUALITY PROTEIN: TRPM8 channel-associated factor homolog [Discoglossus pictus]
MEVHEDYHSLVRGLDSLDFRGDSVPCNLLLTGDSAFPVVVTPSRHVLIAASSYGKGRVVVTSHESYLNLPQFSGFLQNAVSWLKPCPESVIGVQGGLDVLAQTLTSAGCTAEMTSGMKKGLGVFCTSGYDDSEAKEIISFVREGGGLLIGAQAWHWSYSNKEANVLCHFPGNKLISVSGVYFTAEYGETGKFNVSRNMPRGPIYTPFDFSTDLKHLLKDVSHLDINGEAVPSELLLHGTLAFPVGLSDNNQCFLAAAYFGKGRVVVATHESYLWSQKLKPFLLNAISWLLMGKNGQIGVNMNVENLFQLLQQERFNCKVTNLTPDLGVYCCNSYSDHEANSLHEFVAEGGGLLIGGHAWYWSYGNSDLEVLASYPGNRILNKFGISILKTTINQNIYKVPEASECYLFRAALSQLLSDMKSGLKSPVDHCMVRLRQDVSTFMRLPGCPLLSSIQNKITKMVQMCEIPNINKQCPVKGDSKEALILCLAQEVSCIRQECDHGIGDRQLMGTSVTVKVDGTNPGGDAWRSTGLYLPPKRSVILTFPASTVGKGLQVQVGCHSDDLSCADQFCRAPVVIHRTRVVEEKTLISCVWGGLLYIIVTSHSDLGMFPVTVYGAELAPFYINGHTKRSSWLDLIHNSPSPWAELITENIILTVPTDAVRSLEDPGVPLSLWDKIMIAITELAAIPRKLPRPERIVTDVQISAGWMHSGYPIMCHLESAHELTDIHSMQCNGLWGPIHELGHNQQRNVFEFPPHTTEATCNLWSVYVHEKVLRIPRDRAHPDLNPYIREKRLKKYLESGANLQQWNVWTALETYLQLQEDFGWDPFKRIFLEYQFITDVKDENLYKMNMWAEKFSQIVERNLATFFMAWGWPIKDQLIRRLSMFPDMEVHEDYHSLVRGLDSLDFRGDSVPCNLLLTGDSAFPVVVTPSRHVLIAASSYGKGRVVVTSHESYLNLPQFSGFLQNAVSWLKPCPESVIGVQGGLDFLAQTLTSAGCTAEITSGMKKGLGVFCTSGYDDSEAKEIISFVREGGGLLIGAQAWHWSYSNKEANVLCHFPGNKIISVSGVYFTAEYGETGKFNVSRNIPRGPIYTPFDFSTDLKHLLKDVSLLDINGKAVPSELLLHGILAFPVGLSDNNQCFLAAAYFGKGRVVVATHESYLWSQKLKPFLLNAISWLLMGTNKQIGVNMNVENLFQLLQQERFNCKVTNLTPDLGVYCCNSYSDHESNSLHEFVAEGGGLLIGGHAWYWSYGNSDLEVLSSYPGNRILNKFGISILKTTINQNIYKVPEASECYLFRAALSQLLSDMKSGLKSPVDHCMVRLRQDVSTFMRLPGCPLLSSIQNKITKMVQMCEIPNINKQCPVKGDSKEALILCLAQAVSCIRQECDHGIGDRQLMGTSVTVKVDGTNPGNTFSKPAIVNMDPLEDKVLVQVGCHSDDLSCADQFCRAPVVIHRTRVVEEKTLISCVWGGLLYIIVTSHSDLGMFPVTVYGAELAPFYINGHTKRSSWLDLIHNSPSPWAELITENIILTVPTDAVRSLEDPGVLLSLWDKIMIAITELAAIPRKLPRPERIVTDVQISAGWMHSGYPIMCHLESTHELTDIHSMQCNGLWGPIHELGHNQQRNVFEFPPHTTEATCNLWSVYVHEKVLRIPRDRAHPDLNPYIREKRLKKYLESGANLQQWNVWTALETYLQLQEDFGWDPFKRIFLEYQFITDVKDENLYKMNMWAEKFSQIVERNLATFFMAWGWPIKDQLIRRLSMFPEWENNPMK